MPRFSRGPRSLGAKLRLGAGVLAGAAGLVGAWYDLEDTRDSSYTNHYSIAGMYFLRSLTQLGTATLSVSVGLAYAQPYFEYLLKKYVTRPVMGLAVKTGLQASTALALRMAPMLRLLFGLNIALLALMLVEIFLLPNQLQRYLDSCTFRKGASRKIFETEEQEIKVMQNALKGTL